jgi:eukaryotic-like serine/threonine-protein kinase
MAKILAPRLQTPSPETLNRQTQCSMPDAMLSEQVRRLAVSTMVAAGLWAFGLVMDGLVRPATVGATTNQWTLTVEIASIAIAALMFLYVRYVSQSSQRKADLGLLFIVVNAAGVALLNNLARPPATTYTGQLSWNTVVILVGAMIIPGTPTKMLVTALIAASMDPLAVWFAHLRGMPVPSVVNTFVLFMPNYACAAVAIVPSRVLQGMSRRLKHVQELGSYHLVELLGRGGMGEVWRAEHHLLARSAAIKLVRPELLGASGPQEARSMLQRFQHEAQATSALSSPHTIRLFDFGVTEDHTFYYVMELLVGRDLESLVREFGPVRPDRAMFMLRQVCHSLAEAHAQGLVHRDVTPANIYVCRMGLDYDFVKVLDFGLVTFNDRRTMEQSLLTRAHMTTGTPAFMAPEVILESGVDARADIYALGCVAYYLLTGELPFEAETPMKMFVQHLQTVPVPPSQRTELPIPAEIDAMVLACLEKDPARRPQSIQALLEMLDRYRPRDAWNNAAAKTWWDRHLVDLSGPRGPSENPTEGASIKTTLAVAS